MEGETCAQAKGGSVAYAAPEVIDSQRITFNSDVFSLGILNWEILNHRDPIRAMVTADDSVLASLFVRPCLAQYAERRPNSLTMLAWINDFLEETLVLLFKGVPHDDPGKLEEQFEEFYLELCAMSPKKLEKMLQSTLAEFADKKA